MQQCPANLKDKGIFNTLASELVDNDEDYLAIVLQEIAERFTVQSEASKAQLHIAPADDSKIESKYTETEGASSPSASAVEESSVEIEMKEATSPAVTCEITCGSIWPQRYDDGSV